MDIYSLDVSGRASGVNVAGADPGGGARGQGADPGGPARPLKKLA